VEQRSVAHHSEDDEVIAVVWCDARDECRRKGAEPSRSRPRIVCLFFSRSQNASPFRFRAEILQRSGAASVKEGQQARWDAETEDYVARRRKKEARRYVLRGRMRMAEKKGGTKFSREGEMDGIGWNGVRMTKRRRIGQHMDRRL
jgi:hypothetical protein